MSRLTVLLVIVTVAALTATIAPETSGFVSFAEIQGGFVAWRTVVPGPPETGPLFVRIHPFGDGSDYDLSRAAAYLAREVDVRLVTAPDGAPLYLTGKNLIGPSGPAALGATVPAGMAAETGFPDLADCVIAHEIAHFLGLRHSGNPAALMYPRCAPGKLATATLSLEEKETIQRIASIRGRLPNGVAVDWAHR